MSNFAERLVARSTGRAADAGVLLLMPRPVARFEPTGGLGASGETLLEDTGMVSAGHADTLLNGAESKAELHSRDADGSIGRTDRNAPASQPPAPHDAFGQPLPPGHTILNRGPADHIVSQPSAEADPPANGTDKQSAMPVRHRQPDGHDANPSVEAMPSPLARDVVARNEPATPPTFDDVMVPNVPPVAEQAGPVISIGKIEVQFLPKETPSGPPRVQPQRTRGFHTYDRARRGLR
jgi:hypothetical protein